MEINNNQENIRCGKGKGRHTFAVLFYINRTKIRKDGACQVLCRISIDAEWEQVGTKIVVDPKIWDAASGRATGRSRSALNVNDQIERLDKQIRTHYKNIQGDMGFVTAGLVKNAVNGIAQKSLTLLKLFTEHNDEFLKRVGVDRNREAYDIYQITRKHLSAFIRRKYDAEDVTLRSLNMDFFDAFDLFLRTERGLQQKTIHQHLYNLKKITKRAVSQGTLRRDPYHTIFPELPPLKSRHLKLDDLEKLMQCRVEKLNLQRVRDWFVFSSLTGLAFCDVKQLQSEHILTDQQGAQWIRKSRQKTKVMSNIPLTNLPLKIIEKYKLNPYCIQKGVLLPVMSNQKMNSYLKELGDICEIHKELTMHVARHSILPFSLNISKLQEEKSS